ncbi:MAG TPA: M56 family metallopeptidase [Gemmatimonadales bacterium]|jgi:beta-lactamase regulating signal transducer with metallopeptidase domain|nr:M56 family metallopeptidase [Gemmatimonadales bacterium]
MLALLFEATVKGSLILALAAVLASLMRSRSAAARHLVWGIALLSAAAMPLATSLLPAWRVSLPLAVASSRAPRSLPTLEQGQASIPASGLSISTFVGAASSPASRPARPGHAPASGNQTRAAPISLASMLILCWALVAAALLARFLTGAARLARLSRGSAPVNDASWRALLAEARRAAGVTRPVRLLASEHTTVPLTWGIAHPVLLLPPDYQEWSAERRRAVLIHELAHVARWDSATHLAAQVCCALYWFNPLIWLAARAFRSERERACDDRVLAAGTRASTYAGELLEIARSSLGLEPHGVALAMARRSELEGRLLAILNPEVRRGVPHAGLAMGFGAAALVLTLPLAAFRPAAAPAKPVPADWRSAPAAARDTEQTPGIAKPARLSTSPSSRVTRKPEPAPVSLPVEPAPVPDARSAPGAASLSPCDQRNVNSRHSHSSSNWSDGGKKSWRVSWSGDGCSVDLVASGDVKFNADFSDVTEISSGGYLEITVREGESVRRIEFRPRGGTLQRSYTVNGSAAPYDDAARAWLAEFLIDLDRHTGFAIEARFPALLKQGVGAVLDEIDRMFSDYARGLYYRKLFTSARLSQSEVRRAARAAGTTMESDYELGRVLAALAEQYSLADGEIRTAFIEAAGTLESDYERAQLLLVVIGKGAPTPEAGRTIVKLAGGMSSDYEKSRVLMALGGSRLVDPKTAEADYLDVVAGMRSDYERGRVLGLVVGSGQLSKEALIRVLDVTRTMTSDYEAANVLIGLAAHNKVEGGVKDAYLTAADRLKSDYERQRARAALRSQ